VFYAIAALSCRILKKEGMGGGDIILAAAVGANLSLDRALLSFFLAAALGSVIGIALILAKRTRGEKYTPLSTYVPFGPMIVAGTMLSILYGAQLIQMWRDHVGLNGY
jgi:prepilin signal peptidase PulO-like enzyme (type II secretory pathway)